MKPHIEETYSPISIHIISLCMAVTVFLITKWIFWVYWNTTVDFLVPRFGPDSNSFILNCLIIAILFGIHELIHALTYIILEKKNTVRFGVVGKHLWLMVHTDDPMRLGTYRVICLMPAVILGVFPVLLGFWFGWLNVVLTGGWMIVGSTSDILLFFRSLKYPKNAVVWNIAESVGFMVNVDTTTTTL